MTLRSRLLSALAAGVIAGGIALVAPVSPAHAAAGVGVTVEGDPSLVAVADPTYVTELRLNGSGFQSIQNGFGGIYVMFGTVSGTWRPSEGGATGVNYSYVPDDETNPTGYVSFVTFPGSSTSYAANGGELAADGTWSTVLTVPGATFTALDRDGNPTEINCLQVQCGIITIGAHGVKNANNETFTPVTFRDLYSESADAAVAEPTAAATPAPTRTVVIEETAEAAGTENTASSDDSLVTTLLWIAGGVGVLAVAAVVFLVWAVLSARRRQRRAEAGAGVGAGSAAPGSAASGSGATGPGSSGAAGSGAAGSGSSDGGASGGTGAQA